MEPTNEGDVNLMRSGPAAETRWFGATGAGLVALAAFFVWRDLAVGAEYLLIGAALVALLAQLLQRPRSRPHLALGALLGCTLVAGAWFAGGAWMGAVPNGRVHPFALLTTMGIAVLGCVVAAARAHLSQREAPLPASLVFPITLIGIVLSATLYYQFFTIGFAADQVARRLILTLTWLPLGLLLEVLGHARGERNVAHAGLLLVTCAVAKAALYDTTHLDGTLRITALGVAGLLLLGGAWLLHAAQRVRA